MPKRIVVNTIILHRDGKVVRFMPAKAGQKPVVVDLSAEELESIKATTPDAVREPINEAPAAPKPAASAGGGKKNSNDSDEI